MSTFSQNADFLDPDGARLYLESVQERAQQNAANARLMRAQIDQLRVHASDDNGLAEVTIDANGVLVDLELTDRIHRYEPRVTARAVLEALREARVSAVERSREIAAATLGPDSLSARTFTERLEQQLLAADPTTRDVDYGQGDGRG
jgi:DNA-binding protein YbaB